MKNLKKWLVAVAVVGLLAVAGAAYAATAETPAEITAGLTNKTIAEVNQERSAGKTFGAIASEAGQLEQFKAQMLEQKKIILDQRVSDGRLTQEQADSIYNNLQSRQANCNGAGNAGTGGNCCASIGNGNSFGQGSGCSDGIGLGKASGGGNGAGLSNGVCDRTGKGQCMRSGAGRGLGNGVGR